MTGLAEKAARAERRAMIALAAVFALLLQALWPAAAAAATPDFGGGFAICDGQGLSQAPDQPAAPMEHGACKHCACPAAISLPPPLAELAADVVAYAAPPLPIANVAAPPPARAPPRPPGQGPPISNA